MWSAPGRGGAAPANGGLGAARSRKTWIVGGVVAAVVCVVLLSSSERRPPPPTPPPTPVGRPQGGGGGGPPSPPPPPPPPPPEPHHAQPDAVVQQPVVHHEPPAPTQEQLAEAARVKALDAGFEELLTRAPLLAARPDLLAVALSSWDTIEATPGVPAHVAGLQQELMACIEDVDFTKIPDIDEVSGCSCSCRNFVPWRRCNSYARLAYCVGRLPDVKHYMDAFISYGGTAIPLAQGMLDSQKPNSLAVGWEILPEIIETFEKVKAVLPNMKIIPEYTLKAGSVQVDAQTLVLQHAEGSMVDYCRQHQVDVALVDGGYGTVYMLNGEERLMAETWIALDICKPKYILQVSITQHAATSLMRDVMLARGSYVEVVSGTSRGVACVHSQLDNRRFALYVRQ